MTNLNELDLTEYSYDTLVDFQNNLKVYISDQKQQIKEAKAKAKAEAIEKAAEAGMSFLETSEVGDPVDFIYKGAVYSGTILRLPKEGASTFWVTFEVDGDQVEKWRYTKDIVVSESESDTEVDD